MTFKKFRDLIYIYNSVMSRRIILIGFSLLIVPLILILFIFALLTLQNLKANYMDNNNSELIIISSLIENGFIDDYENISGYFSQLYDPEKNAIFIFEFSTSL